MPLDLAALLVEAGAASADDVQRALERQREAGGALDTALLELGLVAEGELVRFLARASGLPPPPPGDLEPDPRARRVFPARVAERHVLAPFRLEGRELAVLAAHPVDRAALDEISFMLSLHLLPYVAPEWRVRQLLARGYGTELGERFRAVEEKVAATATATATATPTPAATPTATPTPTPTPTPAATPTERSVRPERSASGVGAESKGEAAPSTPTAAERPLIEELEPDDLGFSIDEEAPLPGPPPARGGREGEGPAGGARESGFPRGEPEEPLAAALAAAIDSTASERPGRGDGAPEAPPRWTREEAFAALEAARGRDEVVAVALRYARDFFEAAALFAVTRDEVVGHDAVGWNDARARCRGVHLPQDAVGLFRAVLETSGPYLGPIGPEPGNEALLSALGRGWPRIALAYPVAARERPVCILYADNGDAPVSPNRLGDLLLLAGALGGAFERVVREAKRARASEPVASPRDDGGWEAREPARVEAPPAPPPTTPDPFEVGPAAEALAVAPSFDPAAAVQRLRGTARDSIERGRITAQLVQHGPGAAAALRAVFPGPIDSVPGGAEALPVEERGPVLAALRALGIVATPYLAELLLDPDAGRRRLAALLLGRVGDPAGFLPLADRVLDPDPAVAEAAVAALTALREHPDFGPVLERLRRALRVGEAERPALVAEALARLAS